MPISSSSRSRLKAACSVSQMASMVGLSRARFYELMERGVFAPPVYSVATRRPLYLREMQQVNLDVRREQVGINGEYIIFYEPRQERATPRPSTRRSSRQPGSNSLEQRLVPQLQNLGLSCVTANSVGEAVRSCFPEGVGDEAEAEVLRAIYRLLRRQNDA